MRVYFLLSHDAIFKPTLLSRILLRFEGEAVGVGEVLGGPRKRRRSIEEPGLLGFWGLRGAVYLGSAIILRKLISVLPFAPHLRYRSTVQEVARFFGVRYELVADVNAPAFVERVRASNADVILCFQHQILKRPLLEAPTRACLNCHPACLPKYRGVKPIFWAMLDGEAEIGVSVHTMEEKIDCGLLVSQRTFKLRPKSTLLDNYHAAYDLAVDVIVEALRLVDESQSLDQFPRLAVDAKYYRHPTRSDIRRFREKGLCIA